IAEGSRRFVGLRFASAAARPLVSVARSRPGRHTWDPSNVLSIIASSLLPWRQSPAGAKLRGGLPTLACLTRWLLSPSTRRSARSSLARKGSTLAVPLLAPLHPFHCCVKEPAANHLPGEEHERLAA